jgi:hypothetical protein
LFTDLYLASLPTMRDEGDTQYVAPGEGAAAGAGETSTHGLAVSSDVALARTRIADDPGGTVICAWPWRTFCAARRWVSPASRYVTVMALAFEVATRVSSPDADADDVTDSVAVGFVVDAATSLASGAPGATAAAVAGTVAGTAPEVVAPAGSPATSRAAASATAGTIRLDRTRTSPMPARRGRW